MVKKFYVTTPIYYVNDAPHIGHTCTTLAADIVSRHHKALGEDVFFLTGTDEHGAKVAEEAKKAGLSPLVFCNQVSKTFSDIWPKLNINYDYFIRTTNPRHEKIVQELIQEIYNRNDIYKAEYEGLYCVGCEKFITEDELIDTGSGRGEFEVLLGGLTAVEDDGAIGVLDEEVDVRRYGADVAGDRVAGFKPQVDLSHLGRLDYQRS